MRITIQQSYGLLAKYGVFAREFCDKCGTVLGAVRFTRKGDAGLWCSRECRGDDVLEILPKGGRPRKYKTQEDRRAAKTRQQRNYRLRPNVEKTGCIQSKTKDLQTQESLLSTNPLTLALPACKQPPVRLATTSRNN